MTARIRVRNHIPELIDLDDAQFAERVEKLKQHLARGEPLAKLVRMAVGIAIAGLEEASDRDELLHRLLEQDPARDAREALRTVTAMLPPVHGRIACHVLPGGGTRSSGVAPGDDCIVVSALCRGDMVPWLRFVLAHEYSHTVRGFPVPDTVREDLVVEGLAMVFAETAFPRPKPNAWDKVTSEQEAAYWKKVDIEARGLDAILPQKSDTSYEVGARIIRAYLQRHSVSIAEAHGLSNDELYWGSGYPFLH
jgi:hypothetical protein